MPRVRHELDRRPVLHCALCGGQCCRYFALEIDRPTTPMDFDNLRWFLAHEHVAVFIEKKSWYLQVNTVCRHLTSKHACGIYDKRPQICREYGWDESGKTECHGLDRPCDHDYFFSSPEELEAYLLKRGKRWASLLKTRTVSGKLRSAHKRSR